MKKAICIDASLLIAWFLPEQYSHVVADLMQTWERDGVELIAPPLFHAEVTSVLREQVYFGKLLPEDGEKAFFHYQQTGVKSINGVGLQQKAWELAKRLNLPRAYDMQYLAVAELADCELWTADKKLATSLQAKAKRVRWVGEGGGKKRKHRCEG
ncbi:MAG: type II toxin-antitoxin system VapC family toxin [Chloroflexi bacterium]|nr:type II toxin-antitoxin system VapC family toxin [Chloroflexota bacterium]